MKPSCCRTDSPAWREAVVTRWQIEIGGIYSDGIIPGSIWKPPEGMERLRHPAKLVLSGNPPVRALAGVDQIARFEGIGSDAGHDGIGHLPGASGWVSLVVENGLSDCIARGLHDAFLRISSCRPPCTSEGNTIAVGKLATGASAFSRPRKPHDRPQPQAIDKKEAAPPHSIWDWPCNLHRAQKLNAVNYKILLQSL